MPSAVIPAKEVQCQQGRGVAGIERMPTIMPAGWRRGSACRRPEANREVVAECGKTGRCRREVCKVLVDGVDAGLEQIRAAQERTTVGELIEQWIEGWKKG